MKTIALVLAILASAFSVTASTVTYSYDANGRLTRVDYGNDKGYVYRYDANGNLLSRSSISPGRRRVVHTELNQPTGRRPATGAGYRSK